MKVADSLRKQILGDQPYYRAKSLLLNKSTETIRAPHKLDMCPTLRSECPQPAWGGAIFDETQGASLFSILPMFGPRIPGFENHEMKIED